MKRPVGKLGWLSPLTPSPPRQVWATGLLSPLTGHMNVDHTTPNLTAQVLDHFEPSSHDAYSPPPRSPAPSSVAMPTAAPRTISSHISSQITSAPSPPPPHTGPRLHPNNCRVEPEPAPASSPTMRRVEHDDDDDDGVRVLSQPIDARAGDALYDDDVNFHHFTKYKVSWSPRQPSPSPSPSPLHPLGARLGFSLTRYWHRHRYNIPPPHPLPSMHSVPQGQPDHP